jgi:phosphonate dehydrogenase
MAPQQLKVAVSARVHPEVLAFLSRRFAVAANTGLDAWSPAMLAQQCADADGLLAFMTDRVDAPLLRGCPRLNVIACALKGFDNVDVAACTEQGVCVTVSPDLLTAPTAELAVGLALALCRNILPGDAHVRSGTFQGWRPHLYGFGLCGATVGIVGMGAVGRAIAARLAGFQPRLLFFDPNVPAATGASRVSWEGLLEESDLSFPNTHPIRRAALAKPSSRRLASSWG